MNSGRHNEYPALSFQLCSVPNSCGIPPRVILPDLDPR